LQAVGLDHHRHRVPAHVGAQALLDLDVAGRALFLVGRDGVDVGGVGRERHVDAGLARVVDQLLEQEVGALAAFLPMTARQGVQPLAGFLRVRIVGGARGTNQALQTWGSPGGGTSDGRAECRTTQILFQIVR
jgi:hypothetical protein